MAYTEIDKPSDYFDTKLYTGNAGTQSITGLDFQPDWVSIKDRGATNSFMTFDSVRGATELLNWNTTNAESTQTPTLTSFNSDGFSIGNNTALNTNGNNLVAWNWKAGTSFTNDASSTGIGTIDSAGSVNTDAGFSITTFTGTGSAGTVAHGLGAIPKFLVVKSRSNANGWIVYHASLGAGKGISLDLDGAAFSTGSRWNSTEPTSTVFSLGTAADVNRSSGTHVCYAFSEKQGYSKFGSYTGNGNASGPFCYTGMKPAFILRKRTDSTGSWLMQDNKRPGSNRAVANSLPTDNNVLYSNTNDAELFNNELDILSNGFKLRATDTFGNGSGATYIYMAFAENPFVTSTGVPATAK